MIIDLVKLKEIVDSVTTPNISQLSRDFNTTRTTVRKYMKIVKELSMSEVQELAKEKEGTKNEKTTKKKTSKKTSNKSTKKAKSRTLPKAKTEQTSVLKKVKKAIVDQLQNIGAINASALSRDLGIPRSTLRRYITLVENDAIAEHKKIVDERNEIKAEIKKDCKPKISYMIGNNIAMVDFHDGKGSQTIMARDCNFELLTKGLQNEDMEQIKMALDKNAMLEKKSGGKTKISEDNKLMHNDKPVSSVIQRYVNKHFKNGDIPDGFFKFLDKIYHNDEYQVTACPEADLMEYIDTGDLIITDSGNILAYKIVDHNYMDKYSRTIKYKVGEEFEMPREKVVFDRNNHCAGGYHACTFKYFGTWANAGDRMLVCEIDPLNIISIPNDNKSKLRCCKYKMVGDLGVFPGHKSIDLWYKEYTLKCNS